MVENTTTIRKPCFVVRPPHPSVEAMYENLTEVDWELLAFVASHSVAVPIPAQTDLDRLHRFGLIMSPSGHATASGYALLLAWHRRHPKRPAQAAPWWAAIVPLPRRKPEGAKLDHVAKMRLMIDYEGAPTEAAKTEVVKPWWRRWLP